MPHEEEPEEKSDEETIEESDEESDEKSNEEHEEQPCASEEPALSSPPKHTPEHTPKRARVSKCFFGRWKSDQDWTTFHTQKEAADFFDSAQGTISLVLSGKKNHNNFELKY